MRSSAIQALVAFLSLANAACKDEPAEACPAESRVEISRPGYRSQVLESVRVVEEGCNVQTVRVAAALAPTI